jgi:hypothetical protein
MPMPITAALPILRATMAFLLPVPRQYLENPCRPHPQASACRNPPD